MPVTVVRSNVRSLVGLLGVALLLAVVVRAMPQDDDPPRAWQPPAGYTIADAVPVSDDVTVRLWTSPTGWYVERVSAGRSESSVGAARGGDEFAVSEVLGGLVGTIPSAGARTVSIRPPGGITVRADVHDRMFVAPAYVADATGPRLLVTPLDATGRPLAAETAVAIGGRG